MKSASIASSRLIALTSYIMRQRINTSSVKEFQWALYNTDGELCVEGTTDISSALATVTLLLTGDGDLEKVEELFE